MIYAVIDTNVFVAALLTKSNDSATVKVYDAIADGLITPLYHKDILEEYAEVLSRPKYIFHFRSCPDVKSNHSLINVYLYYTYSIDISPTKASIFMNIYIKSRIYVSPQVILQTQILLKDLPELDFISYNIIEQTAKVQMAVESYYRCG